MVWMNKIQNLHVLILDVDGVLTDGKLYFLSHELGWTCSFHVRDGHAIRSLIRSGIDVAIISGGLKREAIIERARMLGVKHVYMEVQDKVKAYQQLKKHYTNLDDQNFGYIGDDIPDLELLQTVGFSAAPKDAIMDVLEIVDYTAEKTGGNGAVREVADIILKSQERYE